jgi:hypothetical protein
VAVESNSGSFFDTYRFIQPITQGETTVTGVDPGGFRRPQPPIDPDDHALSHVSF